MILPLPSNGTATAAELRPFRDVRLVAADLDGTLVGHDGRLWDSIVDQIRALRQRGVKFTIATGRTLTGVQPLLRTANDVLRDPIVLYNGAVVAEPHTGRLINRQVIRADSVAQVAALSETLDIDVFAYVYEGPEETLLSSGGEKVLGWSRSDARPQVEFNEQRIAWQVDRPEIGACAMLIDVRRLKDKGAAVSERLASVAGLTVTSSGGAYLEIRPLGSQKWAALTAVTSHLGIDAGATLAVGDNHNDAEMLKEAAIGVCVANAPPELYEHADYVSGHDSAAAVLETLRTVRGALRYGAALDRLDPAPA